MKFLLRISVILIIVFSVFSCTYNAEPTNREVLINTDWKFKKADIKGAELVSFDDSDWRSVDLPHDFSIEDLAPKNGVKQIGPFAEDSPGKRSTGHVLGGTAWYRKHFTLQKEDEEKIIKVLFDGIYMNSDVWINGKHLGNHPYGYTAFYYNLTPFLNPPGHENILAVQVKNLGQNSRWYSGSGIYRNVKLIKTNPTHVDLWGVCITTPKVSKQLAQINSEIKIKNDDEKAVQLKSIIEVYNPEGKLVVQSETDEITIQANETSRVNIESNVLEPRLWSPQTPDLYSLKITLVNNNKVVDVVNKLFGIRSIEFSAEKGFLLNGENTLLKGACMHHDNGILGSAAFKSAEYRRVKIMKDYGFNAIRTAHNPPSELFLNACDELGMLVIDESFDQWQLAKNPQDYHLYFDQWWEKDMEAMLLRDRNHPSIIIWSIGNEIKERADSSGLEIARFLKHKVKDFDTTRPVTQAICSLWEFKNRSWEEQEKAFEQMDVHGYNYQWQRYRSDHDNFPGRIMIGTESVAREAYENWDAVENLPYVIGDFVWTGMDYFGEAGIGNYHLNEDKFEEAPDWPWFNANCGDIDILGNKKPQMYFKDVVWRNSPVEILVHAPIPSGKKEIVSFWGWPNEEKSWNWNGYENKLLQVDVYSRADKVKLLLNGKELGTKIIGPNDKLTAHFDVRYQPGELSAIAYRNGREIGRQSLKTSGKAASIKVFAEKDTLVTGADDLAYFNVEVRDKNGQLVPDAEIPIKFTISGDAKLQAVGNANPTDMKSFKNPVVNTFRGRCQLILRVKNKSEKIEVGAFSGDLKSGRAELVVR